MRISANRRDFLAQNPELPLLEFYDTKLQSKDFRETRPVVRVYEIDQTNGFIYSVKHFNPNGQLIFSRNVGKIRFDVSYNEDEFAILEKPQAECMFVHTALRKLQQIRAANQPALPTSRRAQKEKTIGTTVLQFLEKHATGLILLVGFAFLASAFYLRRR